MQWKKNCNEGPGILEKRIWALTCAFLPVRHDFNFLCPMK